MTLSAHRCQTRISYSLLTTFCLVSLLCQKVIAQAPPTFTQALEAKKIGIAEPELTRALKDPDKQVRGLAAAELAEQKRTDRLPQILQAAVIESDPSTKVNIAAAATWLGSTEGLSLLKTICLDSNLSPDVRLHAARNVFDKRDHTCFPPIVDMMLPQNSANARISASYLLSQLHDLTPDESSLILARSLLALRSDDLLLRLETAQTLRWLGNPAALPDLRRALSIEIEAPIRECLTKTIDVLQNMRQ